MADRRAEIVKELISIQYKDFPGVNEEIVSEECIKLGRPDLINIVTTSKELKEFNTNLLKDIYRIFYFGELKDAELEDILKMVKTKPFMKYIETTKVETREHISSAHRKFAEVVGMFVVDTYVSNTLEVIVKSLKSVASDVNLDVFMTEVGKHIKECGVCIPEENPIFKKNKEELPVTEDWLRSIGFVDLSDGTLQLTNDDEKSFALSVMLSSNNIRWLYCGPLDKDNKYTSLALPDQETRAEALELCAVLGFETKEEKDGNNKGRTDGSD